MRIAVADPRPDYLAGEGLAPERATREPQAVAQFHLRHPLPAGSGTLGDLFLMKKKVTARWAGTFCIQQGVISRRRPFRAQSPGPAYPSHS